MSDTAARVVAVIEQMIPESPDYSAANRVTCFVAPEYWTDRPVTIIGKVRSGEPKSSQANHIRIAVTSNVLPGAYQRFAFQLAHELAHVKMDPRIDNKLVETFAVAISFEVIHRLGFESYVETNQHYYSLPLPSQVRSAISKKQLDKLSLYLRFRWKDEESRLPDYSLQMIGAVLIRSHRDFPWKSLRGIALKSTCRVDADRSEMRYCALDDSAVPELRGYLNELGRDGREKLVVERTSTKPKEGQGFAFVENGFWITLRETTQ
jgi:hypothetical protein